MRKTLLSKYTLSAFIAVIIIALVVLVVVSPYLQFPNTSQGTGQKIYLYVYISYLYWISTTSIGLNIYVYNPTSFMPYNCEASIRYVTSLNTISTVTYPIYWTWSNGTGESRTFPPVNTTGTVGGEVTGAPVIRNPHGYTSKDYTLIKGVYYDWSAYIAKYLNVTAYGYCNANNVGISSVPTVTPTPEPTGWRSALNPTKDERALSRNITENILPRDYYESNIFFSVNSVIYSDNTNILSLGIDALGSDLPCYLVSVSVYINGQQVNPNALIANPDQTYLVWGKGIINFYTPTTNVIAGYANFGINCFCPANATISIVASIADTTNTSSTQEIYSLSGVMP
jgi:hypothetical protein